MWWVGIILGAVSAGGVWALEWSYVVDWDLDWVERIVLWFGIEVPLALLVAVSWWLIIVVVVSFVASILVVDHFKWEWPIWIATFVGLNVALTIVAGLFVFALGIFSL